MPYPASSMLIVPSSRGRPPRRGFYHLPPPLQASIYRPQWLANQLHHWHGRYRLHSNRLVRFLPGLLGPSAIP